MHMFEKWKQTREQWAILSYYQRFESLVAFIITIIIGLIIGSVIPADDERDFRLVG